jgi:hypothetical protein
MHQRLDNPLTLSCDTRRHEQVRGAKSRLAIDALAFTYRKCPSLVNTPFETCPRRHSHLHAVIFETLMLSFEIYTSHEHGPRLQLHRRGDLDVSTKQLIGRN